MFSQSAADAANPAVRIGFCKVVQPVVLCHGSTFSRRSIFIAILFKEHIMAYPSGHAFVRFYFARKTLSSGISDELWPTLIILPSLSTSMIMGTPTTL